MAATSGAMPAEGMGRCTREQWEALPLHPPADFLFNILFDGVIFNAQHLVSAPAPVLARAHGLVHARIAR